MTREEMSLRILESLIITCFDRGIGIVNLDKLQTDLVSRSIDMADQLLIEMKVKKEGVGK